MDEKKKGEISVEISRDIEGGVYVNQAIIAHSQKEFVIDLGVTLPGNKIKIQSRIITNPIDAKAIMLALKDNIEKYEQRYGIVDLSKAKDSTSYQHQIH
ncbi:MAG: DUF3467 domain-containing protein [bacterium]